MTCLDKKIWSLAFFGPVLPVLLGNRRGLRLDSFTFVSSLLALPQKTSKQPIHRFTIPGIGPALFFTVSHSLLQESAL
jgi:hypothetical protein